MAPGWSLLLDEADLDWVAELEAKCNWLELAHAASIEDARALRAGTRGGERCDPADASEPDEVQTWLLTSLAPVFVV